MGEHDGSESVVGLPTRPVQRLTRPLVRFLHVQAVSGLLLLAVTIIAVAVANSSWAASYKLFWDQPLRIGVGAYELAYPLWYWINDALMTVFFFVIGLEVKRELVSGELSDRRKVVLPVIAALGGVVAPIGIFFALQSGGEGQSGWAIPMATDIAFVVGAMALLGDRVPRGLKILMLSLAIVDDILAVAVIAIFYSSGVNLGFAVAALGGLALTAILARFGVRSTGVHLAVGAVTWLLTLKSGIHPTLAGVALGLLTPASAWLGDASFLELLDRVRAELVRPQRDAPRRRAVLNELGFATREAESPLVRLELALHPWVAFAIMPVFALANAGVAVSASSMVDPLAFAVAAGLFIGKPLGICGASWIGVRVGLARLPAGVSWRVLLGGACLGGIGFTMALFVASLGLSGAALEISKSGVLAGSLLSGVTGMGILWMSLPRNSGSPPAPE